MDGDFEHRNGRKSDQQPDLEAAPFSRGNQQTIEDASPDFCWNNQSHGDGVWGTCYWRQGGKSVHRELQMVCEYSLDCGAPILPEPEPG